MPGRGGDGRADTGDDGPPAKKRKLSIRRKADDATRQTTLLDHFLRQGQSGASLPNTVTRLHASVNDTTHTPDDELAPRAATSRPSKAASTAPETRGTGEDKRSLRSHDDGPRLRSELAIYFPNYEDIIFDTPREEELVDVDTVFYVTEEKVVKQESVSPASKRSKGNAKAAASSSRNGQVNGASSLPATPQRSSSNQYNGSPSLNLDSISRTIPEYPEDPLPDEHYLKAHKRAERKEKQLRNIEKERAMHEKVQLDRLLDGLKGHDWLKVLGITGITDGEARKYEEKRDYFIAEVQGLVDKFRQWKEQEKKQRIDKEAAAAREGQEEEDEEEEGDDGMDSDDNSPPSSDLNASAARQLQQETAIALKSSSLAKSRNSAGPLTPRPPLLEPPSPEVPMTSFYSKRHLRDAALGKSRHGRNVTAFGHPVPELPDLRDFELPEEYRTRETLRANAREKRRKKRAGVAEGAAPD